MAKKNFMGMLDSKLNFSLWFVHLPTDLAICKATGLVVKIELTERSSRFHNFERRLAFSKVKNKKKKKTTIKHSKAAVFQK